MRRSDNGLWGYHGGAVEPGYFLPEWRRGVLYRSVLCCEDFSGDPLSSNEEVLEQRWFTLNALPEDISLLLVPQKDFIAAAAAEHR